MRLFAPLLLLLLAILGPDIARADDLGVTRVDVTEGDDGRIEIVARVPLRLVGLLPPPELLDRGVFEAEGYVRDGGGGARFVFTQGEGRLGPQDVILLPWQRQAALARVRLSDGTTARRFFRRTGRGIEIPVRGLRPDRRGSLERGQASLLEGMRHVMGGWAHLALLLLLGIVAPVRRAWALLTAFLLGQLAAGALGALVPARLEPVVAEIGFVLALAFVAHATLRPWGGRRAWRFVLGVAGLFHGLGLAALVLPASDASGGDFLRLLLIVLGIDAAQIVGVTAIALLAVPLRRVPGAGPVGRGVAYATGIAAMAVVGLFVLRDARAAAWSASPAPTPRVGDEDLMTAAPITRSGPGSQLLAPKQTDAPVQSFLTVEPFEVRHDVLLRVKDVSDWIDSEIGGSLGIAGQAVLLRAVGERVAVSTQVTIDGAPAKPIVDRVDFVEVTAKGTFPRLEPVRERWDEARIGVVVTYLTSGTAREVTLRWVERPTAAVEIPAAVTDPESSQSTVIRREEPVLRWENRLMEDPIPTVAAVTRAPPQLPIPWAALPLLGLTLLLFWRVLSRLAGAWTLVFARVSLAAALLVAPLASTAVALPDTFRETPSPAEAQRILGALLPNVYRSFSFRDESDIYDKLAVSVTEEQLRDIYLTQRRALEIAERGGARARVEAVEVLEVREVAQASGGRFVVGLAWAVGGSVSHFGHRHFRQNWYDALVTVVPVGDAWKIGAIEVLDQRRVL